MKRLIPLLFGILICTAPQSANGQNFERWWGQFCNEEGQCLSIGNVGEGPISWYFSFALIEGDTVLGDAMAALEGDTAGFANLVFTMREDGDAIIVTFDSGAAQPEGEDWISKVREGVYARLQ